MLVCLFCCFSLSSRVAHLARLGFDRLRQGVATQTGEERALVGVSVIHKQVVVGTLGVHEGEI